MNHPTNNTPNNIPKTTRGEWVPTAYALRPDVRAQIAAWAAEDDSPDAQRARERSKRYAARTARSRARVHTDASHVAHI